MKVVLSSSSSSSPLMSLLLLLVLMLTPPTCHASGGQAPTSIRSHQRPLVLPLIHHDSLVHHLHHLRNNSSMLDHPMLDDYASPLLPDPSKTKKGFYVKLRMGSQRVEQILVIDTGSSLNWVTCSASYYARLTSYDPLLSSTYSSMKCYDETCKSRFGERLVRTECSKGRVKGKCIFHQQFVRKLNTGSLGRDSFWWGIENGLEHLFPSVVFGCSTTNVIEDPIVNGILALGDDRLSFLRQADRPKFGHCMGDLSDTENLANHQLLIGYDLPINQATPTPTPITVRDGKYTVLLKSFTFDGNHMEDGYPTAYDGGMILDTGSTITFLPEVVYNKLRALLTKLNLVAVRNDSVIYEGQSRDILRMCYNGRFSDELHDWRAEVKLVFDGDATLFLRLGNLFQQYYDDLFCLAILPSEADYGKIILGNLMMQYNYFVYDTSEWKLTIGEQCCAMTPDCFPDLFD